MTVNSQQNKISYIGNGVATEFAIPFSYLDKSHLSVWQMLNGVQSERTDWTAADGTLIFKTAPENNAQIVIMRQVPLTQETDYRENEILPAETLERCFDKLTMQVQQLEEKSGRAVTVDVFDDTNAASLIPSIRKAVSDATAHAENAALSAATATAQANATINTASQAIQKIAEFENEHAQEKADIVSLKNGDTFTDAGKTKISALSFPSSTYSELTATNGQRYVAEQSGYYFIEVMNANSGAFFAFDDGRTEQVLGNSNSAARGKIQVLKNESFVLTFNNTVSKFRFYPVNI